MDEIKKQLIFNYSGDKSKQILNLLNKTLEFVG